MTQKEIVEFGAVLLLVLLLVLGIPIFIHHGNVKEAFRPEFKPYDDHTIYVKLDEVQFGNLITTFRGEINDTERNCR